MAIVKRIVCLANSRKYGGRCVAGKELIENAAAGWVRPISSRETAEVSDKERHYKRKIDPKILDVIDIPLIEPSAKHHQRENWMIYPKKRWERLKRLGWSDLREMVDPIEGLWMAIKPRPDSTTVSHSNLQHLSRVR